MPNKARLLLKLTVDKDLRTVERKELKGGKITQFFDVIKIQFNEMLKVEILFLLFAFPAIILIGYYMPILIAKALQGLQFASNMGIGYTEAINSPSEGIIAIYSVYKMIMLYLAPAITLCGIGAAGMFYCARGYMWGEPVVIRKAFFRGIKKLWKYFLPVFAAIGVIVSAAGYSIINNLERVELGTANALSHGLMIISIIALAITLMISIFLLPMFACYKFKFKDYLKNSVILNLLVLPVVIMMAGLTVVPFLLISNETIKIVLLTVLIGIGFMFIAMMWTAFAQNIFYTMINGMYEARLESERKKAEKSVKKIDKPVEFNNPKKKGKQAPYKKTSAKVKDSKPVVEESRTDNE